MYELRPKTNNVDSFFLEYGGKLFNTDGTKNLSVDGTGKTPSVNEAASVHIRGLIKILFKKADCLKVLDIGSGLGYLQKALDDDPYFETYSFEGASELIDSMVCNKNKVVICDLAKEISDKRLYKAFHLTTSFEFLEHVPRTNQKTVWKNIRYLSDFHLCSIHVANQENEEHRTIMKPEEWEAFFVENKITYQKLGGYPLSFDVSKEFFRTVTGLFKWDCSVFYLLDFRM